MRAVYIADDGKEFDNEYECMDYEWTLNHPNLKDVHFYDKDNNELTDIYSEESYCITEKVIVDTEEAIAALQKFTDYTGYCSYESIDECGEWFYDMESGDFVKN